MQTLSWASIGFYCLFCIFIFYQQLHVKNFQGSSQVFALAINISALLGFLTGLAYLGYYGWKIVWWAPIIIFVIGLLASILGILIERVVGSLSLSMVAFECSSCSMASSTYNQVYPHKNVSPQRKRIRELLREKRPLFMKIIINHWLSVTIPPSCHHVRGRMANGELSLRCENQASRRAVDPSN